MPETISQQVIGASLTERKLFFVSDSPEPISQLLAVSRSELREQVVIISYADLYAHKFPLGSVLVFCGVDTLPEAQQAEISSWISQHAHKWRVVNRPYKGLGRYNILLKLHEYGVNRFRAYRLTDEQNIIRYPVFLRSETRHGILLSDLITSKEGLDQAIDLLRKRNGDMSTLLVVEFCAERDDNGLYYKYSAFGIGSAVIPAHLYISPYWWVKSAYRIHSRFARDLEASYLKDNPHREEVARVFKLCDIGFGRIDYGFVCGVLQVFEVNLNPLIINATSPVYLQPSQQQLVNRLEQAILALLDLKW